MNPWLAYCPRGCYIYAMSKTISLLFVLAIPFLSQGQVDVSTVDIPVPVRVMEGDKFIDNLTTGDFELLEDGKPQEIQALYLIKGSNILSRETRREFNPILSRHFFFLFQLIEYNAKLAEMINHLFQNVLLPTDNLYLQTPMKNYSLTPQAMAKKPKEALAKEMNSLLRKDILNGSSEYNSLLRDL